VNTINQTILIDFYALVFLIYLAFLRYVSRSFRYNLYACLLRWL